MSIKRKTVIVTGASRGIGAASARAFLERGYCVVATSRTVAKSKELPVSDRLVLIDGDIGQQTTAMQAAQAAVQKFGSIDALVNNAGIFLTKPFVDYSIEDLKRLVSTNLEGFLHITQQAVRQMRLQKSGGSVVTVTAALADNPILGTNASIAMMAKGGLNTVTRSLALEYAKEGIRFNAVAPGVVDTPLHAKDDKEVLKTSTPMGIVADVKDVANAILYLTEASAVTGEVLHVDGGSHSGKW